MKKIIRLNEHELKTIIKEGVVNTLQNIGVDPRNMMSDFGDDPEMEAAKIALDHEDEEVRLIRLIKNTLFNGERIYDKIVDFNKVGELLNKEGYEYSGSSRPHQAYYFDNKNNGYRLVLCPQWFFPEFGGRGKIRNLYISNTDWHDD